LAEKTEKLERDIANLNAGMKRLEQKLDKILSSIGNSNTVIDDVSANVSEVKNNLRLFNQSERQLFHEINSKLSQQLQAQFDEIHSLQSNLQKTQKSAESVEKFSTQELNLLKVIQDKLAEQKNLSDALNDELLSVKGIQDKIAQQQSLNVALNDELLSEVKKLSTIFSKEQLTKDDLKAIESFLRLIAANQMIQETYLETK
ncbi:MAG: hypothetical protein IJS29_10005, partial [Selenomonadaceae bacterium]|nr:hypothetical protein [Selenomonadaceae bacterium]